MFKAEFYSGNNGTTIKTYYQTLTPKTSSGIIKLRLD